MSAGAARRLLGAVMACPLQSGVFPQHICNVLLDCTSGAGKHKPALCYWTAPAPVGIRKVHITSAAHADTKLNDIMKLELLEGKTADEIEHLWMTHHATSSSHIATVLSREEHIVLSARAAASPLFVLPLAKPPRAFQTLLLQWQPPGKAMFTTLEAYKQQGPAAPAHLVVRLYDELSASHGLVLARGHVVTPQLISTAEGRTVLELARALYTDAGSYKMVYAFNHQPDQFDFQQLCRELGVMAAAAAGTGGETATTP